MIHIDLFSGIGGFSKAFDDTFYEQKNEHIFSDNNPFCQAVIKKQWYSNKCALIWKEKVTKSNRLLFQLQVSTHRTDDIGSGLLPTARVSDSEGGSIKNAQMKNGSWSRVNKKGIRFGVKVKVKDVLASLIDTPTASMYKGSGKNRTVRNRLDYKIEKTSDGRKTGLKLQPSFVAWMMGFPLTWTELPSLNPRIGSAKSRALATQSSRK